MNSKNPEISIIIPVHNRIQELKRALNSINVQTFRDFEIIIVDDYSDEPIQKSINNSFEELSIHTIRLSKKCNANIARNKGIEESNGKYIAFLDSDDEWKKTHLEHNLTFIKQNQLDGVYGGIDIIRSNEKTQMIPRTIKENECFANYLFEGGLCSTPTLLIKSNCFEEIKFDENLSRHQDWDFGIRFHNLYNFKSINSSTVIVHWEEENERKIDLYSSQLFFQKHYDEISYRNYHKYHRNMYHLAKKLNANRKTKNFYKQNALKYFNEISITDFMSVYEPKSIIDKVYLHLIYTIKKTLNF